MTMRRLFAVPLLAAALLCLAAAPPASTPDLSKEDALKLLKLLDALDDLDDVQETYMNVDISEDVLQEA